MTEFRRRSEESRKIKETRVHRTEYWRREKIQNKDSGGSAGVFGFVTISACV